MRKFQISFKEISGMQEKSISGISMWLTENLESLP